ANGPWGQTSASDDEVSALGTYRGDAGRKEQRECAWRQAFLLRWAETVDHRGIEGGRDRHPRDLDAADLENGQGWAERTDRPAHLHVRRIGQEGTDLLDLWFGWQVGGRDAAQHAHGVTRDPHGWFTEDSERPDFWPEPEEARQ